MYQHTDLLAAQSMARERERETVRGLHHREVAHETVERPTLLHRLHEVLVRAHLVHVPTH